MGKPAEGEPVEVAHLGVDEAAPGALTAPKGPAPAAARGRPTVSVRQWARVDVVAVAGRRGLDERRGGGLADRC